MIDLVDPLAPQKEIIRETITPEEHDKLEFWDSCEWFFNEETKMYERFTDEELRTIFEDPGKGY